MRNNLRFYSSVSLAVMTLAATACGGSRGTRENSAVAGTPASSAPGATEVPAAHHSKLGGAAAGAVAGHMLGGHAVAGAAAGALIQHERNKHRR